MDACKQIRKEYLTHMRVLIHYHRLKRVIYMKKYSMIIMNLEFGRVMHSFIKLEKTTWI